MIESSISKKRIVLYWLVSIVVALLFYFYHNDDMPLCKVGVVMQVVSVWFIIKCLKKTGWPSFYELISVILYLSWFIFSVYFFREDVLEKVSLFLIIPKVVIYFLMVVIYTQICSIIIMINNRAVDLKLQKREALKKAKATSKK